MGIYILTQPILGTNDYREPIEYMIIDESYSPSIHRINAAIKKRAMYPDSAIEPPPDTLMQWSVPPAELVAKAASKLKALQKTADIKKGMLVLHCAFGGTNILCSSRSQEEG
jgi:ATP-dependent DNA helicase 2 subunit 2